MVKVSKLMRYAIIIFLLLDNCFFNLIPLPSALSVYMSFWNKILIGTIALILFLTCILSKKLHRGLVRYNGFINRYSVFYIISIIFVMVVTVLLYSDTSLKSSFTTGCHYFVMLMYAPILISMKEDDSIDNLLKLINVFAFIWYSVVIVQSVLYSINGNVFIQYLKPENGADPPLRNSMLRISLVPFGNFAILYNCYRCLSDKHSKKKFCWINLIMGLYCLFFVQQTRAMIAIILACIAILLIFAGESINTKLRNILILAIAIVAIFNTGAFDNFLGTFFSKEYSGSADAREYAINYYGSVFIKNPLIGFGFVNSDSLIHGAKGTAFIDDVGLWGQMARLGIFFFIIMIPLLIRMCKIVLYLYKQRNKRRSFFLVTFIYLFATSFTLMILDPARIALLPFIIALFEFEYNSEKQLLKKNLGGTL